MEHTESQRKARQALDKYDRGKLKFTVKVVISTQALWLCIAGTERVCCIHAINFCCPACSFVRSFVFSFYVLIFRCESGFQLARGSVRGIRSLCVYLSCFILIFCASVRFRLCTFAIEYHYKLGSSERDSYFFVEKELFFLQLEPG